MDVRTYRFLLLAVLCVPGALRGQEIPRVSERVQGYAILAGGNLDYVCSNIEGAVAALGNIRLNRMSVGTTHSASTPAVSSRGNFSLLDGSVSGNVESASDLTLHHYYAGAVSAAGRAFCSLEGSATSCRSSVSPTVSVGTLIQEWIQVTAQMVGLAASPVSLSSTGELKISVTSAVNVFEVQADDLVGAKSITVEGSSRVNVIVHVRGRSVEWKGTQSGIRLLGGIEPGQISWLFRDADKVAIHHTLIPGTVLVPNGSLSLYEGSIEGAVYARGSVIGNPLNLPLAQRISCRAGSAGAKIVGTEFY